MRKQTLKINQILAAFQIAGIVFSQNVFAADLMLVSNQPVAVVSATTAATSTAAAPIPADPLADHPLSAATMPPLPAGYTRAASNINFAFQVKSTGTYGKSLVLRDLRTNVEQTLAGYSIETYGENIFKVYDVSPDGQFVVFADKSGDEARLQRIDNPASKISVNMAGTGGLGAIEWAGTGSASTVILTNLVGSQSQNVLVGSQKVTVLLSTFTVIPNLPAGYVRAESNVNFAFQVDTLNTYLYRLKLMDLRTGQIQILATSSLESYGDKVFKVRDVSPSGEFVVFADKGGSEARLQRIDNPASKISVSMAGTGGLGAIEWAGTGSASTVILTNLIGSQSQNVLVGSQKVTVLLSTFTVMPNNLIQPSQTLSSYNIRPLPTDGRAQGDQPFPTITTVAPAGAVAILGQNARGIQSSYETRSAGWAGVGFTFDNFSTTGIETGNLSILSQLTFGVRGDTSTIKLEVVDSLDRKAVIHLTGIRSDIEGVWSIPVSSLTGIDLGKVRMIYFIVEGDNKTGALYINQYPLGSSFPKVYQSSTEITALPGNPANNTVIPNGATASMTATGRGGVLTYNSGAPGWVGGGFNYDNFSTTAIETADFSVYKQLIFGLKGSPLRVKLEFIDDQNKKADFYLEQIRTDLENEWAVSTADIIAAGVNLQKIRMIYFIIEGVNQSGTLEINRMPTVIQPNMAANIQALPESPTPRVVKVAPATGTIATVSTLSRGARLDYQTGTPGWAGVGFTYDDPATPAVESVNLSTLPYLGFGIKGNATQVKLELVDADGRKASVKLTGIRSDLEQRWAISLLPFAAYGIDLTRIRTLYFIVEGQNQNGILDIYRL